jgi:hypothetical protein
MNEQFSHIDRLFVAELQFRLASAVRLAANAGRQPLDLPLTWSHGKHVVRYEEVALREDQGQFAAVALQRSATFLMAVAIKDAIKAVEPHAKSHADTSVVGAYQIARLIRNAFAHSPFEPVWSIDPDCQDREFSVPATISLNTQGLQGTPFDWRHYGGPLALFRLSQFTRTVILKDPRPPGRVVVPLPMVAMYQQGDLVLERVSTTPPDDSAA